MECSRDGQSGAMPVDSVTPREWRSDLLVVLPIRTKRLDIFPKDVQKQISEAKRMGTLPDLSAMLFAQLGLIGGEGSSVAVPRVDAIPPSNTHNAGKGKKRKRGGSGTERSVEETSDVPPSGELQTKKKRKRTKKKSADEGSGNLERPTETEGGNVQEEELRPEEEVSADRALGEEDDEEEAVDGQESEASLGDAGSDNLEEESEGSPLLIRGRGDEADGEERLPAPISPYAEGPSTAFEGETPNRGNLVAEDNAPLLVLSDTSAEGSRRGNEGENVGMLEEVPRSDEMHVSPVARESSVRASELSALNDRESDRED
ncbi:hypothetical protein IGI04_008753 [Brassica rapa subsp. trilocularis]|uniref:Uncharacterized protein n=1 Tax=Brassica rapa subsp. trilocularis TaxID=1813537 RepID=A0ABQ7MVC2_BRACM|nr:hypothetical protein IGI04_008753 [Brassica rapa subsp. trilocularis]